MPDPNDVSQSPGDLLDAIIAEYVQQVEAGNVPNRESLLARHPELAERLRAFFADYDRLDRQAAELRLSADPNRTTDALGPAGELPRIRYFGDYELLEAIARGGMGVVYKARQMSRNRVVALKMVLRGELATERDVARFRAEAEAAANLDHPHIVPIYEVGEHDGQQYYSMRYVEGTSLARRPQSDARNEARLVAAVAGAVHHAHRRGVLHRDIKPSNILVAPAGAPLVTDFGLAKRLDADRSLTESGAIVGTPRYMAPEQAAGRKDLTIAVDVYSLGVVLYERLTGRTPFEGQTVLEVLRQAREQGPPRPSSICPGLDRDLETICLKCLSKEPARRYSSAEELAKDLHRFWSGEPIRARPVGAVERAVKWVRRHSVVAALAAAVLLVTLLGVAGIVWKYFDAEQQKGLALQEADKAIRARNFLASIFELAEKDVRGENVTVREILAEAETRIPVEFEDRPDLSEALVSIIGKVKRRIGWRVPKAMILGVRGTVRLPSAGGVNKAAVPQALVHLDDRLTLSADGQVQLVFLSDLHKERLKPGREVTIDHKGCEPAEAVLERDNSVPMTFVRLPKATFYMGYGQRSAEWREIKEEFEVAVHDVTQGQWEAVMGNNPSFFSRTGNGRNSVVDFSDEELKLFPVEQVSWYDANEFIKKLNEKERGRGYVYRLPTGAEWEYACRGGATSQEECSYHFYFDKPTHHLSPEQANFNLSTPDDNSLERKWLARTTRVGAYPSNKLGLCDMHGNVWQWCADAGGARGGGSYRSRMLKGGCWFECHAMSRAGYLFRLDPTLRYNYVGFRLARVPVR